MDTDRQEDDALEAMFAQARDTRPSPDLRARVMADAERVQAELATVSAAEVSRGGWITGLVAAVGGWGAFSGITAAGIVGLAIGFAAPDTLQLWFGGDSFSAGFTTDYGATPDLSALWVEVEDV